MHCDDLAFAICRESKSGPYVFSFELGKIVQNFVFGHARSEPLENVVYGDPHAANARPAAPFSRLDRDTRVR